MSPLRIEDVRGRDGVPLSVRVIEGSVPGPAFVILHGLVSHAEMYDPLALALAARTGRSVVLPDRRGSGRSGGPRGHAASPRHLLDDLERVVRTCASTHGPPHLIGVSLGGLFALAYALEGRPLASRLALVVPALRVRKRLAWARRFGLGAEYVLLRRRNHALPFEPEALTVHAAWRDRLRDDARRLRTITSGLAVSILRLQRRVGRRLAAFDGEALVLLAGKDTVVDSETVRDRFARDLPGRSRLEIYTEADHVLPALLGAEPLAERLGRFLAGEPFVPGVHREEGTPWSA